MKSIDWKLCLVADAEAAKGRYLLNLIEKAVDSGVTLVQLRAKELQTREFLQLARQTAELLKVKSIPLLINDRIDIALACGAEGVHLGQEDIPLPYARKILGKKKHIGISVNTVNEAEEAEKGGADYLGVGPVYYTPSKRDLKAILGPSGLKVIRERVKIPILAIGGINAENATDVMSCGVDGIAVISALMEAEDIAGATKELLQKINKGVAS
jgi:thiamine-phosphate pyrophosphorylase